MLKAKHGRDVNVVLLLGPPASGKTTLGERLAGQIGYFHFDVGGHCRKHMPPGADLEAFAVQSVEDVLSKESKVLLNGFPKYYAGLMEFRTRWSWAHLDFAFVLQPGDMDELRLRAANRHKSGERPEDGPDNFERRLSSYINHTLPVVRDLPSSCPVCPLDAMMSKGDVESAALQRWNLRTTLATWQRGRSAVQTLSENASERNDIEEADVEVSVCLLSGEERLRPFIPPRSTVATLRQILVDDGETEFDIQFSFMGEEIFDSDVICQFNGFENGAIVHMARTEKPPPPPPPAPRSRDDYPICFTADSIAQLLVDGEEVQRSFAQIKVGDWVRTRPGPSHEAYRRVQRVWAHHWAKHVQTFEIAPGCRLTPGHPVLLHGRWVKPEDICKGVTTLEQVVYQLEVEGHVDTALVGGVVCALLGRYCGEDFGWNIFTRKTVNCDMHPCTKCAKAVVLGLSFDYSKLPKHMLNARFKPY